ncbi:MAG: hypothetical protein ACLQPH_05780 [Acidimicrobiales bacterium]
MEGGITDRDRTTVLRAAVARVGRDEMKEALMRTSDPSFRPPKVVANALNALRKHRDPVGVVGNPQYRAALPYVAAAISDGCLSRTIEALGDNSEDPARDELLKALDQIRGQFSDVTVGVMLASVAEGDMPASDLCFEIAATDERYGLTNWSDLDPSISAGRAAGAASDVPADAPTGDAPTGAKARSRQGPAAPGSSASSGATPEQREARRLKKQRDAEDRRRELEAKRRAAEQLRRARKKERAAAATGGGTPGPEQEETPGPEGKKADLRSTAPELTRRAVLTPLQEQEFDRNDPWVSGVVFVWIPFTSADPAQPDVDGKSRRCVVVAGSPTHLLVRPGYSEGGVKSRDWKSAALRHWKQAGFDQPTWLDSESFRVPRQPESPPIGWLAPEDWNGLW